MIERMDAPDCWVHISADVTKLCPVKDELDEGRVDISYRTDGSTFELHALSAHLKSFQDQHLSHEEFTAQLAELLQASVSSTWRTAGMEVTCSSI